MQESFKPEPPEAARARMNRLERCLFPRSPRIIFLIIACLSIAFAFLLTGRQIYLANWGLIDDHEVFYFLGPDLHLPFSDIWSTLLAKTEVGSLQGRFRPSYYFIRLIETSLWGSNVHLWYLSHSIGFAIFLSSLWWTMHRFLGGWLSGVLTACIALLPLWADVWSRLGPAEIYGAACVGVTAFAADFTLFSDRPRTRNASAILLTLATIVLIGLKETFIPLAAGSAAILIWAGIRKRLSPLLIGVLALVMLACLGGLIFVVSRQVLAAGTDLYANPVGPRRTIGFGIIGLFDAILRTLWLWILPIAFLQILGVVEPKPLARRIADSRVALGAYAFLVLSYAAQCALYRSDFPHHSRYDFPAMLLVPLTCCIIACDISCKIRPLFSERTINHAQLVAAGFLLCALIIIHVGQPPALASAVQTNIETTNLFNNELQRAVIAAKASPDAPIILEACDPQAYEAVYSLAYYMPALGTRNRIAVRLHPDRKSEGKLDENLWQTLSRLEQKGSSIFTAMPEILAGNLQGCISIGLNGAPDAGCSGFRVNTRLSKRPGSRGDPGGEDATARSEVGQDR
jgi:hypothetical protein